MNLFFYVTNVLNLNYPKKTFIQFSKNSINFRTSNIKWVNIYENESVTESVVTITYELLKICELTE